MDQDYGASIISISDEDGQEYELEVLTTVIYHDTEYLAVIPAELESNDDLQITILRRDSEDGEEYLSTIDDEAELEAVDALLTEQLFDDP